MTKPEKFPANSKKTDLIRPFFFNYSTLQGPDDKSIYQRAPSTGQESRKTMMNIEADVQEIRAQVAEISKKLDLLLQERETLAVMKASEQALYQFLEEEPDLYSVRDIRAAYK